MLQTGQFSFWLDCINLPVICILRLVWKKKYAFARPWNPKQLYLYNLFNDTVYANARTAESQCSCRWSFQNVRMGFFFWSLLVVTGHWMFPTHVDEAVLAFSDVGQQFRLVPDPTLSFVNVRIFNLASGSHLPSATMLHCYTAGSGRSSVCAFAFCRGPDCWHVAKLRWDEDEGWIDKSAGDKSCHSPGNAKNSTRVIGSQSAVCAFSLFLSPPFLCRRRRRESERPRRRQHQGELQGAGHLPPHCQRGSHHEERCSPDWQGKLPVGGDDRVQRCRFQTTDGCLVNLWRAQGASWVRCIWQQLALRLLWMGLLKCSCCGLIPASLCVSGLIFKRAGS